MALAGLRTFVHTTNRESKERQASFFRGFRGFRGYLGGKSGSQNSPSRKTQWLSGSRAQRNGYAAPQTVIITLSRIRRRVNGAAVLAERPQKDADGVRNDADRYKDESAKLGNSPRSSAAPVSPRQHHCNVTMLNPLRY